MSVYAPGERLDPRVSDREVRRRHVERYERAIELARQHVSGGTWWDVACGYGYGTVIMPGETMVGIDKDPQVVREAEARYPGVRFGVADVTQAGWATEFVEHQPDVVLSVETLEHLDRLGQEAFVESVAAVLNPGGVFVLACPLYSGAVLNPWHKHEPTRWQLWALLSRHFGDVLSLDSEEYTSTSGPAVQAFAVAR